MKTVRERIGKEWLFFDGGSGTILQKKGLKGSESPERWNLSHPEDIIDLHAGYLNAGCNIFNTNTFSANRFHDPDDLEEVVRAAVRLAKEARVRTNREDAYIALDIGPTGKLLKPLGDLDFEEAVEIFAEVIRYGIDEGVDLIQIETMNDSYEAKAALLAAKENSDLPVFITTTYDKDGKLLTGGTPESLIPMLEGLGADAVGINCSLGPREMMPVIRRIADVASKPVLVVPNAGLPETRHGMTVYPVQADEFAELMKEIASFGVHGMGGCCGTTPEHIRKLIETVSPLPFREPEEKNRTFVSSYGAAVEIGTETRVIGERINPTGKKKFQEALRRKDINYIITQGLAQEDAGADILDVNVGLPGINEAEMMKGVSEALQAVTALPLQIDTSSPEALETALRRYNGKALVNSVSGKQESIKAVFPIVKKYGGSVVALCLDENGIPETADGRIAIAQKIIAAAGSYGIPKKEILIDGLTMTVSSDPRSALVTLETIRRAHEELGCHTVLGVSNVSFGLPQRPVINSYFLSMAMADHLSAAIINPNDVTMMAAVRASKALLAQDERGLDYIEAYADANLQTTVTASSAAKARDLSDETLYACIERGLKDKAVILTENLLKEGNAPLDIIDRHLIPALDKVGKGFEAKTVYLPQLLMSADAAKASFAVIREAMAGNESDIKGRVIMATVKGDIHDIGKNIVKVLLENYGYDVIDLGKDVDPEVIVETAVKEDIRLVGLSALMTTTVPSMAETIKQLRAAKPDTKIIVGGAVLTQEYADEIGADAYGKDAMATVRYADSLFAPEENKAE
ncbi:MAG: homocysteine S-methyltransferase family protein [Solobacterium sp.]|nr:homocysteine S-methyltransferase family protein [Solobacterium sp.]